MKRYKVQYPLAECMFPCEATVRVIDFDDKHIHVELTDGGIMPVPLSWIPGLGRTLLI